MAAHVQIGLILAAVRSGIDGTHPGEFPHGVAGVCRVLAGRAAYNPTFDRYNALQIMQALCKKRVSQSPFKDSFFELLVSNYTAAEREEFRTLGETIPSAIAEPHFVLTEMGFIMTHAKQCEGETVYLV